MQFTYYGQSCFTLKINDIYVLFDPFISGNELAKHIDVLSIPADYICISHGHADHVADAITIAKNTGAQLISSWEIYEWALRNGIDNAHPMNTGGSWDFGDFKIKCVVAQHSSSLPDGSYGGNPMGFIIYTALGNFYYSGDTALTLDMQLIPLWADIQFAVLPIGDNFTMGADDAIRCADFVKTTKVIGVHFDTFGFIKIDHELTRQKFDKAGMEFILPTIGQSIDV